MPDRRPCLAANWKMHKTLGEAQQFIADLLPKLAGLDDRDVVVCPSFVSLHAVVEAARGSAVKVFAQTMHNEPNGAFTGEVSPAMLVDAGADGVILGHSERRQLFGETDDSLAVKVPVALEAGLQPILCVGETEEEREAGATAAVLQRQVSSDLVGVADGRLADVVIAYEPIWAIGTGRTASPEQAEEAIAVVRGVVAGRSAAAAEGVRILYGGSVKPDNAAELLGRAGIDGALVGGASLDPEAFGAIVEAA